MVNGKSPGPSFVYSPLTIYYLPIMTSRLPEEIVPDNDQTRARAEHLARIQELVGNAYPNKFARTTLTESAEGEDTITSVTEAFRKYEPEAQEGGKPAPEQLEAANADLGGF